MAIVAPPATLPPPFDPNLPVQTVGDPNGAHFKFQFQGFRTLTAFFDAQGAVDQWTINLLFFPVFTRRVEIDQTNALEYVYVDNQFGQDIFGAPILTRTNVFFDDGTSYVSDRAYDIVGSITDIGTAFFDAAGRIDVVSFFNQRSRTTLITDHDQASAFSWNTIDYGIDANRLDTVTVTNDDQSSYKIDHDQNNAFDWTQVVYNVNSQGRLADQHVSFDDGSQLSLVFNAQGLVKQLKEVEADGSSARRDFDVDNSFTWRDIAYFVDPAGRLDRTTVVNDNGTSYTVDRDEANAFDWSSVTYDLDSQGRLLSTSVLLDNGTGYVV